VGRNQSFDQRLTILSEALGKPVPRAGGRAAALAQVIDVTDPTQVWLALAVMSGSLPSENEVVEISSLSASAQAKVLLTAIAKATTKQTAIRNVRIVKGETVADVGHTAGATFLTGIQRVVWETTRRWVRDHDVLLLGWSPEAKALRALTVAETERMARGSEAASMTVDDAQSETDLIVPWECRYLITEVPAEPERLDLLRALARFGHNTVNVLAHDLIPVTTSETVNAAAGMAYTFALYLSVIRYAKHIVAVSQASAVEYRGWARALAALGEPVPQIAAVPLPFAAVEVSDQDLAQARQRFLVGDLPMVLVVGSHEPRKNHLAVLQAASLLWREGLFFSLTFIGGQSWAADEFNQSLALLRAAGRPVESVTGVGEALLWSAYRLARFTVFPSLNEGFGLPVVESLSVGTPVITSNFGSMAETAADGGCVLVDPRNDHALAAAMRRLLLDDQLVADLRAQALSRPSRTWDDYAAQVWAAFS